VIPSFSSWLQVSYAHYYVNVSIESLLGIICLGTEMLPRLALETRHHGNSCCNPEDDKEMLAPCRHRRALLIKHQKGGAVDAKADFLSSAVCSSQGDIIPIVSESCSWLSRITHQSWDALENKE
jgi:hypothetical protein